MQKIKRVDSASKKHYKRKTQTISDPDIRKVWEMFITDEKYQKHFTNNNKKWQNSLYKLKVYIDTHSKLPYHNSRNTEAKRLWKWLHHQNENYTNKKDIMKTEEYRIKWENFILDSKYQFYFITNESKWNIKLDLVKSYIDKYSKRPSSLCEDNDTKMLGNWIGIQKKNYKKIKKLWVIQKFVMFGKNSFHQYSMLFILNQEKESGSEI